MFFVYMLRSQFEDWFYVGMTNDTMKRLSQHNAGKVRSTKARRPYTIVYTEEYKTKTEARKRELEIKNNWQIKKSLITQTNMALSSNG